MKKLFLITIITQILFLSCSNTYKNSSIKEGDIIFHTSITGQSKAIQEITKSKYSHVGIICKIKDQLYVLEAVEPVRITSLKSWINKGVGGKYTVMRYDGTISNKQKQSMISYGKKQIGLKYDLKFKWDDKKMYCSELVWKIYDHVGITLCETTKFSDYFVGGSEASKIVKRRYPSGLPLNEPVVTPVQLYDSDLLDLVFSNY
jgi:hypothetical protein